MTRSSRVGIQLMALVLSAMATSAQAQCPPFYTFTGETAGEDVLEAIFASFCLGK